MKKLFKSLPFMLLVGIILGITVGNMVNENTMKVIVPIKNILGQLIMFCVPLIIIGFIAPSITTLGQNSSKFLMLAIILAYSSSLLVSIMSVCAGYALIPHLSITQDVSVKELPADVFALAIPPVMPVMSALILSIMLGLAALWTKAEVMIRLLSEFQKIVLEIVKRFLIPILPFYIFTTFIGLSYNGTVTEQFPAFIQIIIIVISGQFIWIAFLYIVAGIYSGKNPFDVLCHYGPAYLTAIGTMSSAATLSVALDCAGKSAVLRKDMVTFGIPVFANIHLCGSALTEVLFCMVIHFMFYGSLPSFGTMMLFCILLCVFAVGAPGVPGGTIMASLGIVVSILGFDATGTAMVLAIYALQDSFGTACNITSDGALTLILSTYADRHSKN